jgi:hypothetical protein
VPHRVDADERHYNAEKLNEHDHFSSQ